MLLGKSVFSQTPARIVFNNDAYLTMNNSVYVVIENSNSNAITELGTGGRIVSEAENNKIRWMIGTATGIYTVPWNSNPATSNTKIPLTFTVAAAGVGGANQYVDFSTWEASGTTSASNAPWATGVTDMNINGTDSQDKVVDRWWWLGANNYTTKPTVRMTFSYADVENEMGGSNTLTQANLQAQGWNTHWDGTKIWGTVNTTTNQVVFGASENITQADFGNAWVLVDNTFPLPVTLINFKGNCEDSETKLIWTTATEINNDYFLVEKSLDGISFSELTSITGAGNSNAINTYSYTETEPNNQAAYYRLKQVDFNGDFEYSNIISVNPCSENGLITVYPNPFKEVLYFIFPKANDQEYLIEITDYLGRVIIQEDVKNNKSVYPINIDKINHNGVYFVIIKNKKGEHQLTTKLIKQ